MNAYMTEWEDDEGNFHVSGHLVVNRLGRKLLWMPNSAFLKELEGDEEEIMRKRRKAQKELMDLIEKKWDECVSRFKNEQIRILIAELMWGDKVAQEVSKKEGIEVMFRTIDGKSVFESVFNPKGMSDEKILNEIAKRKKAVDEATSLYNARRTCGKFRKLKEKILKY